MAARIAAVSMRRKVEKGDHRNSEKEIRKATRLVAANADSPEDARDLLEMLGLINAGAR